MENKIIILALEKLDTRYTGQWFEEFPKTLKERIRKFNYKYSVKQLDGYSAGYVDTETTPGAFLNFTSTNIWKNNQINKVAEMFRKKEISPGDKFIVMDAWNSGIIQIKYMSELLDIPVEIHSVFHAGSYDPEDFLGRKIKNKSWSYNFERGVFYASDFNYFATGFHGRMIMKNLELNDVSTMDRLIRSGFPFEYLSDTLEPYKNIPKEDLILFPHRIAPEKQVQIFKDLQTEMPEYKWIVCQESNLSKDQYHTLLGKAKIVFSANLQETLGISCYEGALTGALPVVPDRLSYSEMYDAPFKYPSAWTESWGYYRDNISNLKMFIKFKMEHREEHLPALQQNLIRLGTTFFSSDIMLNNILKPNIK